MTIAPKADPTLLALQLEQQLADLNDARLNGADVNPVEFIELQEALEAALAAEREVAF